MYERKYRACTQERLKSTTLHEPTCLSFIQRNPDTDISYWEEGTRKELEASARSKGFKVKDHAGCMCR